MSLIFTCGEGKRGRKRDDDILLSSYLWRIIRGTNFSTREKYPPPFFLFLVIFRLIPSAAILKRFVGQWGIARDFLVLFRRKAAAANEATSRGDYNVEKGYATR